MHALMGVSSACHGACLLSHFALHFSGLQSAFIALPLEGEARRRFAAWQRRLEPFDSFLSFQNPATPHLTLRFWRELSPIEHVQVLRAAEAIAARSAPFFLRINGAATFGPAGRERVLFLTVAFSPELSDLKKRCPWPNPPDRKHFHPHITLARIRHPQRFAVHRKKVFKALPDIDLPMAVDRLRLYAAQNGRKQTPLQDFPFMAPTLYPSPEVGGG